MKKEKYWVCPYCGAHLDYGERCDCRDEPEKEEKKTGAGEAPEAPKRNYYRIAI